MSECLQWLATHFRPDLSAVVSLIAHGNQSINVDPNALYDAVGFAKETVDFGITFLRTMKPSQTYADFVMGKCHSQQQSARRSDRFSLSGGCQTTLPLFSDRLEELMEPKSLPFNIDSSGHSGRQSVR